MHFQYTTSRDNLASLDTPALVERGQKPNAFCEPAQVRPATPGTCTALPYPRKMIKVQIFSCCSRTALTAFAGRPLHAVTVVAAQSLMEWQASKAKLEQGQSAPAIERAQVNYDAYILGPGDGLQIELLDLPELGGRFYIEPDGALYLPRLRALYVEGLTVEELRNFLKQQFSTYVRNPQVYVRPVAYRPIRVYVGGEVRRPGYYTLTGVQCAGKDSNKSTTIKSSSLKSNLSTADPGLETTQNTNAGGICSADYSPRCSTIKSAQGIPLHGSFTGASDT